MPLAPFEELLERSIEAHGGHACPGQVLGVRLALVGLREIEIQDPIAERKKFLVYVEIDRCATDAIGAVTGCRVGKRSLRIMDYGIMAATFVRLDTDVAIRVTAREDSRKRVPEFTRVEGTKYEQQADAYRRMPDELLFTVERVRVAVPEEDMPGPPVSRAKCDRCADDVQDRREVRIRGTVLCRACSGGAYYTRLPDPMPSGRRCAGEGTWTANRLVRSTPNGVPVFGVAGASGSGKTSLLEGLVRCLTARRLRVGVLKHSGSGLTIDHSGRDTDRLYDAGASVVQACDSTQGFRRSRPECETGWHDAFADAPPDLDVLLIEGYKAAPIPKVWLTSEGDGPLREVPGVKLRVGPGDLSLEEVGECVLTSIGEAWDARPWAVLF